MDTSTVGLRLLPCRFPTLFQPGPQTLLHDPPPLVSLPPLCPPHASRRLWTLTSLIFCPYAFSSLAHFIVFYLSDEQVDYNFSLLSPARLCLLSRMGCAFLGHAEVLWVGGMDDPPHPDQIVVCLGSALPQGLDSGVGLSMGLPWLGAAARCRLDSRCCIIMAAIAGAPKYYIAGETNGGNHRTNTTHRCYSYTTGTTYESEKE